MYLVELVGGPVDGKTFTAQALNLVVEVAVMASPKLVKEYGEEELPHSTEQYLLVKPDTEGATKFNDLGQVVNIYKYVPQRSKNASPEL